METPADLFDPKRLRMLWQRPEQEEEASGDAPDALEEKEPEEPARVALDNLEASIRRVLGAKIEPMEPHLKKLRELIEARLVKAQEEAEAAAIAAAGGEVGTTGTTEGTTTSENTQSEPPPPEQPPAEAAPPPPVERRGVKKHKTAPAAKGKKIELDPAQKGIAVGLGQADVANQAQSVLDARDLGETNFGEEQDAILEEQRAVEARNKPREPKEGKGPDARLEDVYRIGTGLGLEGIVGGVESIRSMKTSKEALEATLENMEAPKPLEGKALEHNKAELGVLLDMVEDLFVALKISKG